MKTRTIIITFLLSLICLLVVGLSFARTDHRDFKGNKPAECLECHKASGVMSNHGAFFIKDHRMLAKRAGSNCADCHEQSFCVDCHKGGNIEPSVNKSSSRTGEMKPSTHGGDFVSTHAIKATDNPQNCYRCHQSSFCQDCHSKTNKGSIQVKSHRRAVTSQIYQWNSDHAAEARRNLQSCETCHPDADVCVQCHSSGKVNPHPRNWRDIKNRYRDESGGKTCKKCHITY
jgi:hypothetical protein